MRRNPPLGQRGMRMARLSRALFRGSNRSGKFRQPPPPHGHGGDNRHAQGRFQRSRIKHQAIPLSQIDHVERHYCRPTECDDFLRKDQVLFEVRGIQHHDEHLRRRFAREFTEHHLAGHFFIRAGRIESIGTRQVRQFDRLAIGKRQPPGLSLHSDARVIGDLLPRPSQRIEQCALAGIGVADQRGTAQFGHFRSTPPAWPGRGCGAEQPSCARP